MSKAATNQLVWHVGAVNALADILVDAEIQKSQEKKFPFLWGLWTASLSRFKLWDMLKRVGWEKVIYWDTDSCKFEGEKQSAIDDYNAVIRAQCVLRDYSAGEL